MLRYLILNSLLCLVSLTVADVLVFAAEDISKSDRAAIARADMRTDRHAEEAITSACVAACKDGCLKDYSYLTKAYKAKALDSCRAACAVRCAKEPK